MKRITLAVSLLLGTVLCGCQAGEIQPPEEYSLGGSSLPSLSSALLSGEDFVFSSVQEEESGQEQLVYSELADAGQIAGEYADLLAQDWDCQVGCSETDGSAPDFSADSGQALILLETEDPDSFFSLTLQWQEGQCTVIPQLLDASALDWSPPDPITLEQAVSYLENSTPAALGLPGESMEEYRVYAQEGTVLLDGRPCLCLNAYRAQDHQFQQSFLLTLPDMQLYQLDRDTGEATLLGGSSG